MEHQTFAMNLKKRDYETLSPKCIVLTRLDKNALLKVSHTIV